MAFTLANWCCIAQGPYANVFTYYTADTITSTVIDTKRVGCRYFTSTDPDKIGVGDMLFISHTGSGTVSELISMLVYAADTTGITCAVNR